MSFSLTKTLLLLWLIPHFVLWSGYGQETICSWISQQLSSKDVQVEIGHIQGALPFYARVHDVRVTHEKGTLRTPLMKAWTSPLYLLSGTLRVSSVDAYDIAVESEELEEPLPRIDLKGTGSYSLHSGTWHSRTKIQDAAGESESVLTLQGYSKNTFLIDLLEPTNGFFTQLAGKAEHPPVRIRADIRPNRKTGALLALYRIEANEVPGIPGMVQACGEVAWKPGGELLIHSLHVESELGSATGQGVLDPSLTLRDAEIFVEMDESDSLKSIGIDGPVTSNLELSGPLTRPQVTGDIKLGSLVLDKRRITDVRIDIKHLSGLVDGQGRATLHGMLGATHVNGSARVRWKPERFSLEMLRLSIAKQSIEFTGGLSLTDQSYWFEGEAGGHGTPFWNVYLAGGGTLGETQTLTLQRFSGKVGKVPFYLPHASTLSWDEFGPSLDALNLQFGDEGHVSGSMRSDTEATQFVITLINLPADIATLLQPSVNLDGTISGHLALRDDGRGAQGSVGWEVSGLRFVDSEFDERPPLTGHVELDIGSKRWDLKASLQGLDEHPSSVELSLPIELSMRPFGLRFPKDQALEGALQANGRLAPFIQPFLVDTNRIRGKVSAEVTLGGTWRKPQLNGAATLRDGTYESLYTGTTFTDIQASLQAKGSDVTLTEFRAEGGKGSSITGFGSLLLDPRQKLPFTLNLDLHKTTLVKLDNLDGTASGSVQLTGDIDRALLSGNVTVDQVHVNIPNRIPKTVPTLDVVYVNDPGHYLPESSPEPPLSADPYPVLLNVRLSAPKDLFLTGRGLTSEWAGEIQLKGTTGSPLFYGHLNVQRGEFLMGGTTSPITQGVLNMNGSPSKHVEISLDLQLEYGAKDPLPVTISGSLSSPEIVGLEDLSKVDAVQVAQIAVQLSGGSVGPDILSTIRHKTGLDLLDVGFTAHQGEEIGADSERQLAIQVGKYLPRGMSISVAHTMAREGANTAVDLSLTKEIRLRAEVAQNDDGTTDQNRNIKLHLKWRRDY